MRGSSGDFYRHRGKRLLDLSIAVPLALLTLPVQAAVGFVVGVRLGRPVLYRQLRPGRYAEPFEMIKFRTMTDQCDEDGALKPDADRLTPLGKLLRATSLDELPTLYNVVKGDMSLVGPRPLLMSYLDRYTTRQARRHEVRPGMTGWAQINGRNRIRWEEKFEHDIYYVDNVSLRLDLKILLMTVVTVVRRVDTSADGHATAPEFLGTSITD